MDYHEQPMKQPFIDLLIPPTSVVRLFRFSRRAASSVMRFSFQPTVRDADLDNIDLRASDLHRFDCVVASQVLNCVDYRNLLAVSRSCLKPGGALFVNGVVDYGIPDYFSDKRPTSDDTIFETIGKLGFEIIRRRVPHSRFPCISGINGCYYKLMFRDRSVDVKLSINPVHLVY